MGKRRVGGSKARRATRRENDRASVDANVGRPAGAFEYPLKIVPDDNGTFLVTCPDFPELVTFGRNRTDAIVRAVGALVAVISARMDDREDIPEPSAPRGCPTVALSTLVAGKVSLYRAMREAGVTQAGLAQRLGCDPRQVRRLLDPVHSSRQEHLDAALKALGKRLVVSVAEAA